MAGKFLVIIKHVLRYCLASGKMNRCNRGTVTEVTLFYYLFLFTKRIPLNEPLTFYQV